MERIIFLTFFIPLALWAQNPLDQKPDARSLALGGAGLARLDSWSGNNNPAALAFLNEEFISSSHRQVLGLKALQRSTLSANLLCFGRQIAVNLDYFGFKYFYQTRIMLAYGQQISKSISLGMRLGSEGFYIQEGSRGWLPSSELFLFGKGGSKLQYGLSIKNPFSRKLNDGFILKPGSFSLGLVYSLRDDLNLSFEGESAWHESVLLMSGLEYQIMKTLSLRLGGQFRERVSISSGIGLTIKQLKLNLAYLQTTAFGSEMCLDLSYPF